MAVAVTVGWPRKPSQAALEMAGGECLGAGGQGLGAFWMLNNCKSCAGSPGASVRRLTLRLQTALPLGELRQCYLQAIEFRGQPLICLIGT